jgi:hypothetical protein
MLPRILRSAAVLLLAVTAAACESSPVADVERSMAGEWMGPRWSHDGDFAAPRFTQLSMKLNADGTYRKESRSVGAYGRPLTEATSLYTEVGRFRVVGREMEFHPTRSTSYELSGNPQSQEALGGEPYRYGFEYGGSTITFRYLTAPLDAPQETTERYQRVASVD